MDRKQKKIANALRVIVTDMADNGSDKMQAVMTLKSGTQITVTVSMVVEIPVTIEGESLEECMEKMATLVERMDNNV